MGPHYVEFTFAFDTTLIRLEIRLDYLRQLSEIFLDKYIQPMLDIYPRLSLTTVSDYMIQLSQTILDNYLRLSQTIVFYYPRQSSQTFQTTILDNKPCQKITSHHLFLQNIKEQFMKESNVLASIATIMQLQRLILLGMKEQCMME